MSIQKFFHIVLFSLLFGFTLCDASYAEALRLSPVSLDFSVPPGQSLTRDITIENETDSDIRIEPKVYLVTSTDLAGLPQLQPLSSDSLLSSWISFPKGTLFEIGGRKKVTIPIAVTVPGFAQPGGYYASIAWGARDRVSGVSLSGQPAVNVLIAVPGNIESSAQIIHFMMDGSGSIAWGLPIRFVADIKNAGGAHIRPTGMVEVKNMFGSVVAQSPLSSVRDDSRATFTKETGSILPHVTRRMHAVWMPSMAFGVYRAQLTAHVGSAGTLGASSLFFVLPLFFLFKLSLLVLTTIILLFIYRSARRKVKSY